MDDSIENQKLVLSAANSTPLEFYGLFGMIELPIDTYLILIDGALLIGEIMNCHVF